MRKTKSFYGKHLKASLKPQRVWLKSEDLPSYRQFYVDKGALMALQTNENQLIVGRRGTGKTHLLGSFDELVSAEQPDCLCLKISIMEAYPSTPPIFEEESISFTSKRMAKELFEGFLKVFFDRFLDAANRRLEEMKQSLPPQMHVQTFNNTNDYLTRLMEEIEIGSAYTTKKTKTSKKTSTSESKAGLSASATAGIKKGIPSLSAQAGVAAGKKSANETDDTIEIVSLLRSNLFIVRELVLSILACLKIDTLYILVDEWMELEKRKPSKIQPYFAQMLKTTFFNTGCISVKIASVWHQTSLYDKAALEKSEGIEVGHDIFLAADLDTLFLTEERQVFDFCKTLLFKRLRHICEELSVLERDGEVDDIFIAELFDNFDNFKVFVAASHGIPRELMHLFQICSIKINRDFERHCISYENILEASRKIYRSEKRNRIERNSSAQALLSKITKYMESNGSRLFLVRIPTAMRSAALRKLVDEELVHQVPSATTHRDVCDDYYAYIVDYGNFADWIETKRKPVEKILGELIIPQFPDDILSRISEFEISLDEPEALGAKRPMDLTLASDVSKEASADEELAHSG